MNKKQLIDYLSDYDDETEIMVWRWTEDGDKYYYTNPTLTNSAEKNPDRFELSLGGMLVPVKKRE